MTKHSALWGLALLSGAAWATPAVAKTAILSGGCTGNSFLAGGHSVEQLDRQHVAYRCSTAVLTFYDSRQRHVLFQFAQKGNTADPTIGFGGFMTGQNTDDLKHYTVVSIYYGREQIGPDAGHCDVAVGHDPHPYVSRISCSASVNEQGARSLLVVEFDVNYAPEQRP